ncbi:MAG: LacI family transcriptional regulator, partial [Clostridia bacterium]|nr:LacI family transcriptional regulator [Clostridia bacterium]
MAGVSPSTVSNVINGRTGKMSATTKERVLDCLATTGYRANMVARNLVTGKSMLIGVCLPVLEANATQSDLLENNPFYHEFIDGVQRVLFGCGYECVIRGLDNDFKYLDWIQNRSLDGLIDLGNLSDTVYEELDKLGVPIVYADNYHDYGSGKDVIISDDKYGAYLATKHLLDLGHTNIGFVTSRVTDNGVDAERYKGYKQALTEYGVQQEFVYPTILDYPHGIEFGHTIVEDNLPITAVFCTADIVAAGIAHGVAERGKSVPNDYSIVGFDDIKMMQFITPRLTTVRQKIFEKGSMCA